MQTQKRNAEAKSQECPECGQTVPVVVLCRNGEETPPRIGFHRRACKRVGIKRNVQVTCSGVGFRVSP